MRQIKCPGCNEKCIKHGVLKSASQRWFLQTYVKVLPLKSMNLR